MEQASAGMRIASVALLAEGVDRNQSGHATRQGTRVALLAEGVDRNMYPLAKATRPLVVALLAEGVDRNFH